MTNTEPQFSQQIDPLMPDLTRYANYLCDHPEQAFELVQEAVKRVLARQDEHGPVDNVKKYMLSTLYNLHNDLLRRKRQQHAEVEVEAVVLVDGSPSPDQHLTFMEVIDKIATLPEPHREILQFLVYDELNYAQISDKLGIPQGTVMSRLSRARQALREAMDMDPGETVAELLTDIP